MQFYYVIMNLALYWQLCTVTNNVLDFFFFFFFFYLNVYSFFSLLQQASYRVGLYESNEILKKKHLV